MNQETPANSASQKWIVRIPEVFSASTQEILSGLDASSATALGTEYQLITIPGPEQLADSPSSRFIRWKMPVDHSWPCCPQKMEGFIEKAAQALARKFSSLPLQSILVGQLDSAVTNRYYKTLASNLRGRTLQLFPTLPASDSVEKQAPDKLTLFCLLGKEGLFCGVTTPRKANGFYAGGTRYISHSSGSSISRAGAKIAEALHYLGLHAPAPAENSHWLELGASPGGITSELLNRGYRVTAIDRAALDPRLSQAANLDFHQIDVATYAPAPGVSFNAILSDMNGSAMESMKQVLRLSQYLKKSGLIIFTLKTSGTEDFQSMNQLCDRVEQLAAEAGFPRLARTHLTYNRQEFTLFFRK
ncbi:hypothetical protein JIN85_03945 [Luteolibacter pohnpeiensis]|uniref:Ribosomal RNA methyltransferase FtsJ domain-containing protein n=1 Tax=Luteolibacter pohnpeiensis TaxID=454153 RepID=A0A934SA19_9BACT|nr:SAM-dependent methyltransferase [Luteolibacter pohnpeiensis]MBK1881553.1 hypothetical protein [Luteolibacter pohnpeiensis]